MDRIRKLAEGVYVGGQIQAEDIEAAAALGIVRIVNNRPDGEDPGQPESSAVEKAVRAAGMEYISIPITGMPNPDQVHAVERALAESKSTLLYCRSGMRSTAAWALAMSSAGTLAADDIREAAAAAGYDLSRIPL